MRGSPVYAGKTTTVNKAKGMQIMKEALKEVEDYILKYNGLFKIKNEVILLTIIIAESGGR
jgi:translation initiation factor 2 alpha subunit (eIF-2alpha)